VEWQPLLFLQHSRCVAKLLSPAVIWAMMRKAYLGMNALFILTFHSAVMVVEVIGYVPYSRTLFFPMLVLLPLLLGIMGWKEKDKLKWPAIVAVLLSAGLLIFWVIVLILRLSGRMA
jgi:hypothetical protein